MKTLTLGERIQQLRTANSYSQDMLASLLGVSRQTVSHYEKNRRIPTLVSLMKMAEAFDVPVDTFVSLMQKEKTAPFLLKENNFIIGLKDDNLDFINLTPMETELLECFRSCSDEGRQKILDFAIETQNKSI